MTIGTAPYVFLLMLVMYISGAAHGRYNKERFIETVEEKVQAGSAEVTPEEWDEFFSTGQITVKNKCPDPNVVEPLKKMKTELEGQIVQLERQSKQRDVGVADDDPLARARADLADIENELKVCFTRVVSFPGDGPESNKNFKRYQELETSRANSTCSFLCACCTDYHDYRRLKTRAIDWLFTEMGHPEDYHALQLRWSTRVVLLNHSIPFIRIAKFGIQAAPDYTDIAGIMYANTLYTASVGLYSMIFNFLFLEMGPKLETYYPAPTNASDADVSLDSLLEPPDYASEKWMVKLSLVLAAVSAGITVLNNFFDFPSMLQARALREKQRMAVAMDTQNTFTRVTDPFAMKKSMEQQKDVAELVAALPQDEHRHFKKIFNNIITFDYKMDMFRRMLHNRAILKQHNQQNAHRLTVKQARKETKEARKKCEEEAHMDAAKNDGRADDAETVTDDGSTLGSAVDLGDPVCQAVPPP